MKLTKIRAVGPSLVDFPLEHAEPAGPFVLKGADGLGPVEVTILPNGEERPAVREIVLLVGLQPEWNSGQTAEELRTTLYGLLNPRYGSLVEVRLMEDTAIRGVAEGKVKKMEIGLFSADPEVQITIQCLGESKSYFLANTLVTEEPSIPPGDDPVVEIDNAGTAPSGFRIGMQFTNAVTLADGVIITDNSSNGQQMRVDKAFVAGERLIIDTREGQRGIWRVAPATTTLIPIIEYFNEDSDWMTFFHGVNQLKVNHPFTWYDGGIKHTPAYLGV